jgi:hypothetical protein
VFADLAQLVHGSGFILYHQSDSPSLHDVHAEPRILLVIQEFVALVIPAMYGISQIMKGAFREVSEYRNVLERLIHFQRPRITAAGEKLAHSTSEAINKVLLLGHR